MSLTLVETAKTRRISAILKVKKKIASGALKRPNAPANQPEFRSVRSKPNIFRNVL